MTGWVCQWEPFWIPVNDSFKKAYVEDWVFQIGDTSDFSLPASQGTLFLKFLEFRCLFLRPKEKHRSPRFLLLLM